MKTLVEVIETMRQKHYIHDFDIKDDKIICKETNESFDPADLEIQRTYRYEGDSNPADMTITYGIVSKSGTMGILLDAYGTYADPNMAELIKQIPVKEVDENQVKT